MAKWKCEICGSEFENFHAQGFNHKIYCPLCYFKKKNQELKDNWNELREYIKNFPAIEYSSMEKIDGIRLSGKLLREDYLLNKMQELEKGSDSND